jgi:hypothetical protein
VEAVEGFQERPPRVAVDVVNEVDGTAGLVERFEEREALYVVTVYVGEDDVDRLHAAQ